MHNFHAGSLSIASEQTIERFYTVSVATQDSTGKLHEHKGIFSTIL